MKWESLYMYICIYICSDMGVIGLNPNPKWGLYRGVGSSAMPRVTTVSGFLLWLVHVRVPSGHKKAR